MEIKLRRKGEVITLDGFPSNKIPSAISPTEGLEGIDLTAYSVIYARFGRNGDDRAKALHKKAPRAILVYKHEWRNGWGEGVLLPDRFNPSRVRFYKSATQVRDEDEEAKKKAAEALCAEVARAISGIYVYVGYNHSGVVVKPEQEAFSDSWGVRARTLQEARVKVAKMRPIWKEWNNRVLAIFARRGFQNPGKGNIQIVFRDPSPPHRPNERVGIGYSENDHGSYKRGWIVLEKKGDRWTESRDITGGEANFIDSNL